MLWNIWVDKVEFINHDGFLIVVSNTNTLSCLTLFIGLATRGAYQASEQSNQEPNSNLWQLLLSYANRDARLQELLKKKILYTSPEVQNELLGLMSDMITRHILGIIKAADYYSLMIDETPDVSGSEQAVVCFRLVVVQNLILSLHLCKFDGHFVRCLLIQLCWQDCDLRAGSIWVPTWSIPCTRDFSHSVI